MTTHNSSKALNTALWAAQAFLAVVFLATGAGKLFLPMEKLYALIPWTKDVNSLPVRLIGLSEIIGSIGLILPTLLRIKPQLTSWAAIGIAFVMLLAILFNISMGETSVIGINIILFLTAVFVAWGRFKKSAISQKYKAFKKLLYKNQNEKN